jgi:hypothetical protein
MQDHKVEPVIKGHGAGPMHRRLRSDHNPRVRDDAGQPQWQIRVVRDNELDSLGGRLSKAPGSKGRKGGFGARGGVASLGLKIGSEDDLEVRGVEGAPQEIWRHDTLGLSTRGAHPRQGEAHEKTSYGAGCPKAHDPIRQGH